MAAGRVYLDHLASTPLAPSARLAMLEVLSEHGNPSSPHAEGRRLKDRLEDARTRVAAAWGCRPREAVFTASGTLATQIAVLGAARARPAARRLVLSGVEHPAVADAAARLEREGWTAVRIAPGPDGRVEAEAFLEGVAEGTGVAALMLASHETGALQPVATVGQALDQRGVPLVCDACLGPGRLPSRVSEVGADLIALSAHKFGGPGGLGLLYVRRGVRLEPLWQGGLQEERLHPGTASVAAAVGAAVALEEALAATATRAARHAALLDVLLGCLAATDGWSVVGPSTDRLPGVATLELTGVEGEAAMIHLDIEGVAVSTGSACALGAAEPSAGLLAIGLSRRRAASTVRISMGERVTEDDARRAGEALVKTIARLRRLAHD